MTTVARRAGLVAVAVPLMLMSLLGVFATWPLPCEGVSCATGGDFRGSSFWMAVFAVALLASIAAAVVSMLGKLKIGSLALAFSAFVLAVAVLL